ncbi:MAG: YabP/YqfC family sporulation protein [Clostridia bacterium]
MFINEILSRLQLQNIDLLIPKVTLLAREIVLIEGHKGLLHFSPLEIKFRIKKGTLSVVGEDLRLHEISASEAVVSGHIAKVEYV